MKAQKMDRGTDALRDHLATRKELEIRQTRRGWFAELFGCEARTEMMYLHKGNLFARSLEDSDLCSRVSAPYCYPFVATVRDFDTNAELLTVERPFKLPGCCAKCCCYQQINVSSGGDNLGSVKEECYFFIPSYKVYDELGNPLYKIHPPTCCFGACFNCFTEGNPCCGPGCGKIPCWVFPADDPVEKNGAIPKEPVGKILRKPQSCCAEVFTDADDFDVTFPQNASTEEKALLTGSVLLLNAVHFECKNHG